MAELNVSSAKPNGARGAKRRAHRVDLTAMVDLAFLLITFFMLTTTLAKPHAMGLVMPDKSEPNEGLPVPASRTLTICLGANNKAVYFLGEAGKPLIKPTVTGYDRNGLRKAILTARAQVQAATGKSMIVLIKPSDHSIYENAVDALDEMNITGIQQYAIVDMTQADIDILKQNHAY